MLHATIAEFLQGKFYQKGGDVRSLVYDGLASQDIHDAFFEYLAPHLIYCIADGDTIFYVGKSRKNVLKSLSTLLEVHPLYDKNTIGRFMRANRAASYQWVIHLFTREDLLQILKVGGIRYPNMTLHEYSFLHPEISYTEDFLEQKLIRELHPCFNIAHNDELTRLPEHYQKPWSEIPEKIYCSRQMVGVEYTLTYKAYDFISQKNRKYRTTMYATHYRECRQLLIHLLGFEPEELSITLTQITEKEDAPF